MEGATRLPCLLCRWALVPYWQTDGGTVQPYGLELNYIGGGCGNSTFVHVCVSLRREGVLQGAAVLVMASCHSRIGVAQVGRVSLAPSRSHRVMGTASSPLDWRPAFSEVYQQIVEGHSGTCFTEQNYAGLAKSYPFGIAMLGAEMVIRDPVQRV